MKINPNINININRKTNLYNSKCMNLGMRTSFKGAGSPILETKPNSPFDKETIMVFSYLKPVKLEKALNDIYETKELNLAITGEKKLIKSFLDNLPQDIKDIKVMGINGYGTSAIAFDTEDNKILKISDGNHFPLNRPHQSFDVPIYKKGHVKNIYYYLEEKVYQHDMPYYYTGIVIDSIKEKGFKPYDLSEWAPNQIGMAKDGKLYLIDPECAKYKTIFHAIWDKTKYFAKKLLR